MPSITKRGDTYRITVSMGYDTARHQIRKTTTFSPPHDVTPGKAEKLARSYAYEYEQRCRGMVNLRENIRLTDLIRWYNECVAINKIKENTYINNNKLLIAYVIPYIGSMKLKDITTSTIDSLFMQLHKSGRITELYRLKDTEIIPKGSYRSVSRKGCLAVQTVLTAVHGGTVRKDSAERISGAIGRDLKNIFIKVNTEIGLDANTVLRIRTALSPVFSAAVKKEIILKNPMANATTPKDVIKPKMFLDAAQCRRLMVLLDEMPNQQNARALKILLLTGMRAGELMALHWSDVDPDKGLLHIRYNLYRANGEYKLSTPKTETSERIISLSPEAAEILEEQKSWQNERRSEAGRRWVDRNCVFCGIYGEYMSRNYLNSTFKSFLAEHDFPPIHVHDLRHAHASLLINMGVPVKVISECLGHKNTRTTENIYSHVFMESRVKASDAVSKILFFSDD